MGPALMDEMRAQAERFGAELVTDDVVAVDLTGEIKVVRDGQGNELPCPGRHPRHGLGLPRARRCPNEKRLSGHGVSWCATCDGFFFRDQDIAVVGGGDSAHGGGDLPHPVRPNGDDRPPPRRAARLEDHAGPRLRQRQDRVRLEHRGRRRPAATDKVSRPHAARHESPASGARCASPDCSSPSATTRAPSWSRDQVERDAEGYVLVDGPSTRTPTCRACSPPATSSTTPTGRPSPRPAPAAAAALDAERYLAATARRRRSPAPDAAADLPTEPDRRHQARHYLDPAPPEGAPRGQHQDTSPTPTSTSRGPAERQAGAGRLLGRVVRSVPDDRSGPRRDRLPSRTSSRSSSSTSTRTRRPRRPTG